MTTSIARYSLVFSCVAILVACFSDAPVVLLVATISVALFPPAIFLLAEPGVPPAWIVLLGLSLAAGLAVAGYWQHSPYVYGLPTATWFCWLLLAVVPFALTVYGVVLRRVDP